MKNNNFKLQFNFTDPETNKPRTSLDLKFMDKEEKSEDIVIIKDECGNPLVTQEITYKKSKGLFVDLFSKFGALNMNLDFKNKK